MGGGRGGGAMSRGWSGWVVECADGCCAFTLIVMPAKMRSGNCEGCVKEN